ncbi:MAG TPA: hypothetical protein PKN91_02220 [Steroidobacteraceae bacterium]|nr:hypothetical protein [Steroidobacteraceae bacterium]
MSARARHRQAAVVSSERYLMALGGETILLRRVRYFPHHLLGQTAGAS